MFATVFKFVEKNPTLVYTAFATAVPLIASFGLNFDQDQVLGVVAAALTLLSGVAVRRSSQKATAKALETVPEGYLKLSDLFPQAEYTVPENGVSEGRKEAK